MNGRIAYESQTASATPSSDSENYHPQQVHPPHRLQLFRPAALLPLVVERLDQAGPPLPRDRGVHRLQEPLPAPHPPTVAALDTGENRLS